MGKLLIHSFSKGERTLFLCVQRLWVRVPVRRVKTMLDVWTCGKMQRTQLRSASAEKILLANTVK